MSRDTCRYPSCDREPGQQDRDGYRTRSFCSARCEVRYDHLKADARDAQRADEEDRR
jgi:hypothetical protein